MSFFDRQSREPIGDIESQLKQSAEIDPDVRTYNVVNARQKRRKQKQLNGLREYLLKQRCEAK